MQRIKVQPRDNIDQRARESGFEIANIDGQVYWDESAYYGLSLAEIEGGIEDPTTELAAMCAELAGRIIGHEGMLRRLGIPEHAWGIIAESWRRRDASLYGRFDFAFDGKGPAKLLEYNADTPTALFEASVFQWIWLEDSMAQNSLPAGSDQFNSLHERLIERLREISARASRSGRLHLACMHNSIEDRGLIAYLEECASQAGMTAVKLGVGDIGTTGRGPFVDLDNGTIALLFKLYPWEWMFADAFGKSSSMTSTRFLEPPWKAVLSNKGILPLLWDFAPGHPNLLPAYFSDDPRRSALGGNYARKPVWSREGSNVELVEDGRVVDSDDGPYGAGGFIYQALAKLPSFDGNFPVIGSWLVGERACGIGIREDTSPITKNTSRFVPHAILS